MSKRLSKLFIVPLLALLMSAQINADEAIWYPSAFISYTKSEFSGSDSHKNKSELAAFVKLDYLEEYSFSIGNIKQNNNFRSSPKTSNSLMFLSAAKHTYPDSLPGKLSYRFDLYDQKENKLTIATRIQTPGPGPGSPPVVTITTQVLNDSLRVYNPSLYFINHEKTYSLGLGYSYSDYDSTDNTRPPLKVKQLTPSIGFAFNDSMDWMQVRYFKIDLSNEQRSPGVVGTGATEIKWTHWLSENGKYKPDYIQVAVVGGERLYAVDADVNKVYNFIDKQTLSYSIGANWKSNNSEYFIYLVNEEYESADKLDVYDSMSLYAAFKYRW